MERTCTTFAALWESAVETHPDAPFLVFEDSRSAVGQWSYRCFDDVVRRAETVLRQRGVQHGGTVHVAVRNSPAFVAVWLAVARIGATAVFADPGLKARDLATQIRRTGPVVAVCGPSVLAEYRQAMTARTPGHLSVDLIAVDEDGSDVAPGGALYGALDGRRGSGARPHDALAVMFTSGTTSEPKGVVLTQCNYATVGRAMAGAADLESGHRWLVTLPMFHANAQYYCFAPAIAVGASVAMTSHFSASMWPHQADRHSVTHASLFAAPIRMILARRREDAPSLRLSHVWFAQSLAPGHFTEFADMAGVAPRQLYGMTETVAMVCAEPSDHPRPDFIGCPRDCGRTTRIVDPDSNAVLEDGEAGMLLVGGQPGCDLFAGYLDAATLTASTLISIDGQTWLRTGDVALSDAHGRLRFVGRTDDVVKVSGENVSLTQVEAALAQIPGVLEVAVVPRPDPVRDVVPVAYVVPRDSENPPTREDLIQWAVSNLPSQEQPRDWNFLAELPRTSVGKIRRSVLLERLGSTGS